MRKITLLSLVSLLTLASCGSDDNGGAPTTPENPTNGQPLSVEEGKQQLESNSIDLLNQIENFKTDSALEQIIELAEFLTKEVPQASTIAVAKQLNSSEETVISTVTNVSKSAKAIDELAVAQIDVAQKTNLERFNEDKGIYTWNEANGEFDKTGESDDQIYNIAYLGKNAVFSITDFNSVQAADNTEAPTLFKSDLKIDGITVFSQNYTASIDAGKTVPNSLSNTTFIGGFSLTSTYTNNNNTSATQSLEFKLGDTVITSYNYTINGNLASAENDESELTDIFDNASLSLSFLGATLSITAKDDNIPANTDDLTIDQQIELLNANVTSDLSVNGRSVAKGQFYKDQEETIVFPTAFEVQVGEEQPIVESETVTEDVINLRFLFADGSTSDFETYLDNSFTSAENKFESVIDIYEKLFEDIDFGFDDDEEIIIEPTQEEPQVF